MYLHFQNCKNNGSILLFELLDVEHGSTILHKNVKCNSLGLVLAIDPSPRENSIHYNFQILHNIYHKMNYVRPLRVAVLACNIMLRSLPEKQY